MTSSPTPVLPDARALKSCPFCGGSAVEAETHAKGEWFYGVDCVNCGAQVHESDPQRSALLWNQRCTPPATDAAASGAGEDAPWNDMDTAPRDGSIVEVRSAHASNPAVFRAAYVRPTGLVAKLWVPVRGQSVGVMPWRSGEVDGWRVPAAAAPKVAICGAETEVERLTRVLSPSDEDRKLHRELSRHADEAAVRAGEKIGQQIDARLSQAAAPKVASDATTVAFVQEWLMSGDHDPTQWDRDFAAAIDARCKVASDTGAGLREALIAERDRMAAAYRQQKRGAFQAMCAINRVLDGTPTDATDGATGGGEHGLGRHALPIEDDPDGYDPVWYLKTDDTVYLQQGKAQIFLSQKQAATLAFNTATTPGGDLLEQAAYARGVEDAAMTAYRWWDGEPEDAEELRAAIRALSARNQTDDGGGK